MPINEPRIFFMHILHRNMSTYLQCLSERGKHDREGLRDRCQRPSVVLICCVSWKREYLHEMKKSKVSWLLSSMHISSNWQPSTRPIKSSQSFIYPAQTVARPVQQCTPTQQTQPLLVVKQRIRKETCWKGILNEGWAFWAFVCEKIHGSTEKFLRVVVRGANFKLHWTGKIWILIPIITSCTMHTSGRSTRVSSELRQGTATHRSLTHSQTQSSYHHRSRMIWTLGLSAVTGAIAFKLYQHFNNSGVNYTKVCKHERAHALHTPHTATTTPTCNTNLQSRNTNLLLLQFKLQEYQMPIFYGSSYNMGFYGAV